MIDPIAEIIGDYRGFAAQQRDRLLARGIDIAPYALSHLAFRVPEWDQYVHVRTLLERHAVANRENVWDGRPISCPIEGMDEWLAAAVLVAGSNRRSQEGSTTKGGRIRSGVIES